MHYVTFVCITFSHLGWVFDNLQWWWFCIKCDLYQKQNTKLGEKMWRYIRKLNCQWDR